MLTHPLHRRLALPLGLQLLAILVGSLVVAQIVTLALTVLIPPAPAQRWNLDEVARQLAGAGASTRLERRRMAGPPDISGNGWLVSASSREALARKLNRPVDDVVLAFYTQLPVGGVTVPVNGPRALGAADDEHAALAWLVGTAHAQGMPGGPPPGGMPGGSFPGGGFPGGGFPGGGVPGGGFPGGHAPGARPGGGMPGGGMPSTRAPRVPGGVPRQPTGPNAGTPGRAPNGSAPGRAEPGGAMPAGSTPGSAPGAAGPNAPGPQARGGEPGVLAPGGVPRGNPVPSVVTIPAVPQPAAPRPATPSPQPAPQATSLPPQPTPTPAPAVVAAGASEPAAATTPATTAAQAEANAAPAPVGAPQPIPFRQPAGLLSFASPPFIEGDFVAALRQRDGSWIAVAPRAEPFPNRWQQRVMLWFVLSLLVTAPLAWLFARRIVKPLERFAQTAEVLGRDPAASVLPLSGPAEIGRAARAFNVMHTRLRAFVDDRTAMIGAISHDLRTPLTRLRFRIEDVPDAQREALLGEVEEMEEMISQVIGFIRDASSPGPRERIDFARLVERSVDDAKVSGGKVELEAVEHGLVEVDPLGMRRLLGNLLENALKYGENARVRVSLRDQQAVAEIIDDGPGIPAEEWDQAFEPFYRGVQARDSDKPGTGLGLAVCRSIARAHGGDVQLEQRSEGFVASVAVPLSFGERLPRAA